MEWGSHCPPSDPPILPGPRSEERSSLALVWGGGEGRLLLGVAPVPHLSQDPRPPPMVDIGRSPAFLEGGGQGQGVSATFPGAPLSVQVRPVSPSGKTWLTLVVGG